MLLNDALLTEIFITMLIFYYITNTNVTSLLYTAGLYLITLGVLALLNDFDIYIGFLWVIDLGVGLIFFIFVLHFTTFLAQKNITQTSLKIKLISLLLFFNIILLLYLFPTSNTLSSLSKLWSFHVSHVNYYKILNTSEVTDLQTMKDNYFIVNSFEFFIVNFSLFFGLITSILLTFLVHRIFNILNYSYVMNNNLLRFTTSNFFIRNQNFVNQQNTATSTVIWSKLKKKHKSK